MVILPRISAVIFLRISEALYSERAPITSTAVALLFAIAPMAGEKRPVGAVHGRRLLGVGGARPGW